METSPADNAATRFDKVTFRPPGRVAKAVGFTGSGPSKPAGYEPAQHVDPAVIAEIGGRLQAAPS